MIILMTSLYYLFLILLYLFVFGFLKNKKSLLLFIIFFILGYLFTNLCISFQWILPISFIFSCVLFGLGFTTKDKRSFFFILTPILLDYLSKFLIMNIFSLSWEEVFQNTYYYFTSYLYVLEIFFTICVFSLYYFFKKFKKEKETNAFLLLYLLISFVEILTFFIINYKLIDIVFINQKYYSSLIFFNCLLIILFLLSLGLCMILQKLTLKKVQTINEYKEQILVNQFKDLYIEKQNKLFKIRHDITNMIETLKTYKNTISEEIAEDLTKKLHDTDDIYYTDNELLNAILVNKIHYAKSLQIETTIDVHIKEEIPLSNSEIISLFTNLLDNAIHASSSADIKKIHLDIYQENQELQIQIKNTTSYSPKEKKKSPYHGFGLKIIKEIIHNHKGKIDITPIDSDFIIQIIIPC